MTHIAVVDDDQTVADSTGALLTAHGFETSIHNSAEAFLSALPDLPPCCILLDLKMPGLSGLELQRHLRQQGRDNPIIILTAHGNVGAAVSAMKMGAVDFLEKPCESDALVNAVDSGIRSLSETPSPARLSSDVVNERLDRLTARERDVLNQLVQGKINKVIAHELGISQRTVEIHRSRIKKKMEARSLADLIAMKQQHDAEHMRAAYQSAI